LAKLAFLFPGQGSQSVGMLAELAADNPVVEETFRTAGEALEIDLWGLLQSGPAEHLALTAITQPLMLSAGVAVWRVWQAAGGVAPDFMAGHSLGEYSALVCAEALEFGEAIRLVHLRGRYMQEATPVGSGAMAAVMGLEVEQVAALCEQAADDQVVVSANINAPGQVVIAGDTAAVERAMALCKSAGAKRAVLLPVSAPFHCALMKPAADRLQLELEQLQVRTPTIPVLNNVDLAVATTPEAIRDALYRQIFSPVPWVGLVERLVAEDAGLMVECGPGKVLASLGRRIAKQVPTVALAAPADVDSLQLQVEALNSSGKGGV